MADGMEKGSTSVNPSTREEIEFVSRAAKQFKDLIDSGRDANQAYEEVSRGLSDAQIQGLNEILEDAGYIGDNDSDGGDEDSDIVRDSRGRGDSVGGEGVDGASDGPPAGKLKGVPYWITDDGKAMLRFRSGGTETVGHNDTIRGLVKGEWPRWHSTVKRFLEKREFEEADESSIDDTDEYESPERVIGRNVRKHKTTRKCEIEGRHGYHVPTPGFEYKGRGSGNYEKRIIFADDLLSYEVRDSIAAPIVADAAVPDLRTPADPPRPAADPPAPRPAPAPAPAPAPVPARGPDARRDDAAADARMERLAREMREQTAAIQRMTEESARRHADAMRSIEEAQRRNEEARTARAAEAARITAEAAAVRNAGTTERVILDTIDPHAREMAAALDAARPEGITGPELIAMKRAILERDSMILTDGIRRITSKAGIEVILKQRQQYDSLSTWSKWNLGQAFGIVGGTAVGGAGIAAMGITAAFGAWLWPGLAAGAAAGAAFRSIRHRIEIDRKTGRGTEWYHRNPNLAAALGATTFGAAGGAAAVVASWPSVAAFMKSLGGSAMGSIKSLLLRATSLSI